MHNFLCNATVIVSNMREATLHSDLHSCFAFSSSFCGPLQVKETVRDVRFLHNELFFAAAQRKYVYIYDKRGIEVHCLKVS